MDAQGCRMQALRLFMVGMCHNVYSSLCIPFYFIFLIEILILINFDLCSCILIIHIVSIFVTHTSSYSSLCFKVITN